MTNVANDTKVGKYWEYTEDQALIENNKIALGIVEFRKKAENKVLIGEWTEEEYKKFSNTIKRIIANKFYEFIDIAVALLETTKEEIKEEIVFLSQTNFISNKTNASSAEKLANLIYTIQIKLFSISNYNLTEPEKSIIDSLDEKIKLYEDIIIQIQDPTSEYYKLYEEFYKEWVNKTFNDENIKNLLLSQQVKIIKRKQKNINSYLRKLYFEKHLKEEGRKYDRERGIRITNQQAKRKAIKIH